ncbi:MAG: potassium transporter, partial [Alphaproteobacteria bacterium]
SMLMTPFLFMAAERIAPATGHRPAPAGDSDIAPQGPIIIAGIGRFGQVTNRLLQSAGLRTTVLDHDLATVRLMRRFGFKAYLGDPTRPDLLRAAGIEKASILVAALDEPNQNTRLVRYARRVRPDLWIIARARDRVHVFELYRAGADKIVREVFDSAVRAGRYALEKSGFSDYEAARQAETFWRLDRQAVRRLAEVWKPGVPVDQNPDYVALAKALNRELELALMEVRDGGRPEPDDAPEPAAPKASDRPPTGPEGRPDDETGGAPPEDRGLSRR